MRFKNLNVVFKSVTYCALFLYSASGFSEENKFYDDPTIHLRYELDTYDLVDYWTEDRMAHALPKEAEENQPFSEHSSTISDSVFMQETPTDANLTLEPHKYAGKLFFTIGKTDYMCSAQLVGAANILLTAAHCIKDENTGEWAKNTLFVQQYDKGLGQKRKVTCQTVKNGWKKGADKWRWDYGFMKIAGPAVGGYMGIRTKLDTDKWAAMGYPTKLKNGQVMQTANGSRGRTQNHLVEMLNNGMGKGSSGGAWYIENTVIGLNSFINLSNPGVMWSPDFDKETLSLYEYAKNECKE